MIPLSKISLRPPDLEWVAQVSLLRPGFLLRNRPYRNTHSKFVRAIFNLLAKRFDPIRVFCVRFRLLALSFPE